jgi:hypothetical protein
VTAPRHRARLTGLVDKVTLSGDPPTLKITLAALLTDDNIDNVLLLADFKRHGGPIELELATLQLSMVENE